MSEEETDVSVDVSDDAAAPEFDTFVGVVTDGVIGAVGGLVGTVITTLILLVAASLDAFSVESFATLAALIGTDLLFPQNAVTVGYLVFLGNGMIVWPLFFASIGSYLPGDRFALKGLPFGAVLWTGFAVVFNEGYVGTTLLLYLAFTLLAHLAYGFSLGAVFDYLSKRPETLV